MTPDPIVLSAGLNQNFQLFRAEAKVLQIAMIGYDLATATGIEWRCCWSPYSVDAANETFVKKTLTAGIVVAGTNLEITLASADTAAMQPGIYYHELKVTQADDAVKVAMTGNAVIRMSLNMEGLPR